MEPELQCSYADAEHNHLLDGIRMSTEAKVRYFEQMVSLIVAVGARDYRERPDFDQVAETGHRLGDGLPAKPFEGNRPL